jgi:Fe-S-cluster-containing dehydrogenase component
MRLTSYPIKIRETVTDFIIYNNNYYFNKYLNQNFCSISADFVSFEYNYIFDGKIIDFGNKINLPIISRNSYTSSFDILSPLGINDNKDNLQLYGNLTVSQQTQWAMLVDIDKCIGCNLCMLACQIENNIPVVGIENIKKNRDLYWIYIARAEDKVGRSYFIPVMCQHCENAPCESVCPVGATSHSSEGINEMTYNQCIGSRFCMVNCPYSVRKFNFIRPEKIHLNFIPEMMNPFVSVRPRGVSEKCTFCIHRINFEKRRSKLFGLPENLQIKTACEEVCPVGAIKFGKKENLLTNEANQQIFTLLRNFNTKPNVFNKLRSNEEIKS